MVFGAVVNLNAPLMVTDSISGTMKMFGRKVKSDLSQIIYLTNWTEMVS